MRMDDFEKSFKKCKIDESSGQTENTTTNDTESISPTTTLTTTPTTILIDGIHNNGDDANTEEWGLGTNVYMTSTLTSSPNNNKQKEYSENSPTATLITNENERKCQTVFTNTNPTSSDKSGNTIEVFTITDMTNSPITIMIPSFKGSESSVYDNNTLPDLTQQEEVGIGNYKDISDEERTFMDENVENDCYIACRIQPDSEIFTPELSFKGGMQTIG